MTASGPPHRPDRVKPDGDTAPGQIGDRKVGALVSLGIEGEEAWDILYDIPNDSAAALILLEHHWAVPLRDARPPRCARQGVVIRLG